MTEMAPIRDDFAPRAALAEIERLFRALPQVRRRTIASGAPMTLVDAYERQKWPGKDARS